LAKVTWGSAEKPKKEICEAGPSKNRRHIRPPPEHLVLRTPDRRRVRAGGRRRADPQNLAKVRPAESPQPCVAEQQGDRNRA